MYLTVRKTSKGWVAEKLTVKDGELKFEKLHDPGGRNAAIAYFKIKAVELFAHDPSKEIS